MDNDDRDLLEYWKRPGPGSLIELLRNRQRAIYLICLRVLRHPQDAEDAAQEVLVELVRGADRIREPLAFRRWLSRVALNTALEHLRRRARRIRREERSAAMRSPPPPDPASDPLYEAMARLEDEDRCLLVEKYFEGVTLERLAAREGLSVSGMGKRLDRAREALRRKLSLAGCAPLATGIEGALDAGPPLTPVPDLVSTSAAVKSAVALAGGAVMGTKLAMSVTAVIIVLIAGMMIGAGAGYWVGFKRAEKIASIASSSPGGKSETRLPDLKGLPSAEAEGKGPAIPAPSDGAAPPKNPLADRLDRFQKWMQRYDAENRARTMEDFENRFVAVKVELLGVRDLILKDPETFLEWIADPDNAKVLEPLFDVTLTNKLAAYGVRIQEFSSFPPILMDGLLRLLRDGTAPVRMAILNFAAYVQNPSEGFRSHFGALMSDPNPFIAAKGAQVLMTRTDPTPVELESIYGVIERMEIESEQGQLLQALARLPKEETREWLFKALESGRFGDRSAYQTLGWWVEPGRLTERLQIRAANILATSLQKTSEEDTYMMTLWTALSLPSSLALPLVHQAQSGAPTDRLRKAAAAVLEKSGSEGVAQRTLQETWMNAFNAYKN